MTTHEAILPLFSPMAKAPARKYRTLVADPPWAAVQRPPIRYDGVGNGLNDYPTMSDAELMAMPVGLWAESNAHLYLWCLNSNIVAAHKVAQAWGFEVKTLITWVKGRIEANKLIQHIGLGYYYRNSTEHVLFAVRGSLGTLNSDVPSAFIAPRKEHSEKPAAFYDFVARMSPGPFLDVFARKQRFMGGSSFEVMDTFGDQAFNFGTSEPPEAFVNGATH